MNIKSPQMFYRELFNGMNEKYYTQIVHGDVMQRGGNTSIQSDCRNHVYVPAANFARNADGTCSVNDTGVTALSVGTNPQFAVGTDILMVAVGVADSGGTLFDTYGNPATAAIVNRASAALSSAVKPDAIAILQAAVSGRAVAEGELVAMVTAYDAANPTDCTIHGRVYLLETGELINYGDLGIPALTAAISTTANRRIGGWGTWYGGTLHGLASGGLPSTWEADGLEMARRIYAQNS